MTYHLLNSNIGAATMPRAGFGDAVDDLKNDIVDVFSNDGTVDKAAPADAVTTFAQGTSPTMADFVQVGNACKPMNVPALQYVKAMQLQMNRVAQAKGLGTIGADGTVGPATLALIGKIIPLLNSYPNTDNITCMAVSADSDVWGNAIQAYADSFGAPPPGTGSTGTLVSKTGKKFVVPSGAGAQGGDLLGAFAGLSTIEKVSVVAALGGIAYLAFGKRGAKRGTSRR